MLFGAVAVTWVFRRWSVKVFKKIITCRYCTLVCKQSVLFVNVSMNGKVGNGAAGGMLACIEGLPPLPKSLSGLLNSSGGSWREMERMYVKKTMIQDDLSRGRNNTDSLLANKPANLDAALALLRKEMVRGYRIVGNSCSPDCRRSFNLSVLVSQSELPNDSRKACFDITGAIRTFFGTLMDLKVRLLTCSFRNI